MLMFAFFFPVMLGCLALVVDVGRIRVARIQTEVAADAASAAALQVLRAGGNRNDARDAAFIAANANRLQRVGSTSPPGGDFEVALQWGDWNWVTRTWNANPASRSGVTVQVSSAGSGIETLFAGIFNYFEKRGSTSENYSTVSTSQTMIAAIQPRDFVVVVDVSRPNEENLEDIRNGLLEFVNTVASLGVEGDPLTIIKYAWDADFHPMGGQLLGVPIADNYPEIVASLDNIRPCSIPMEAWDRFYRFMPQVTWLTGDNMPLGRDKEILVYDDVASYLTVSIAPFNSAVSGEDGGINQWKPTWNPAFQNDWTVSLLDLVLDPAWMDVDNLTDDEFFVSEADPMGATMYCQINELARQQFERFDLRMSDGLGDPKIMDAQVECRFPDVGGPSLEQHVLDRTGDDLHDLPEPTGGCFGFADLSYTSPDAGFAMAGTNPARAFRLAYDTFDALATTTAAVRREPTVVFLTGDGNYGDAGSPGVSCAPYMRQSVSEDFLWRDSCSTLARSNTIFELQLLAGRYQPNLYTFAIGEPGDWSDTFRNFQFGRGVGTLVDSSFGMQDFLVGIARDVRVELVDARSSGDN